MIVCLDLIGSCLMLGFGLLEIERVFEQCWCFSVIQRKLSGIIDACGDLLI